MCDCDMITPEELVRKYVVEHLVTLFGYQTRDIEIEFPIKMGNSRKRVDIAIFRAGKPHTQTNVRLIVECKRSDIRHDDEGQSQLISYMSACPNAIYGILASYRWQVFERKQQSDGAYEFLKIHSLPNIVGTPVKFNYKPPIYIYSQQNTPPLPKGLSDLELPHSPGFDPVTKRYVEPSVRRVLFPSLRWPRIPLSDGAGRSYGVGLALGIVVLLCVVTLVISLAQLPTYYDVGVPPPPASRSTDVSDLVPLSEIYAEPTAEPTQEVSPVDDEADAHTYVVIDERLTSNVNVRQTDSRAAPVIGVVAPGERLRLLGFNGDQSWASVQISNGATGWILARYVAIQGVSVP